MKINEILFNPILFYSVCLIEFAIFRERTTRSLNLKDLAECRFESPISISKLNNYSDFGRKSGNYFNAKIFIKYFR